MEIFELRIGNWVLIPTNNEIKIPAYPKKIKGITKFGELDFTEPQYPEPHLVHYKHSGGIEITHNWLINHGFSHDAEQEIYNREEICLSYADFYEGYTLYVNHEYETGKPFKYIHQFQNLYYDLTHTEFEVREG